MKLIRAESFWRPRRRTEYLNYSGITFAKGEKRKLKRPDSRTKISFRCSQVSDELSKLKELLISRVALMLKNSEFCLIYLGKNWNLYPAKASLINLFKNNQNILIQQVFVKATDELYYRKQVIRIFY